MRFTLEIRVPSTSFEPIQQFSLNFTQMFLLVRQYAELIFQLHMLKVKVTLHGHVIYLSFQFSSIFPEPFKQFSLNFTQMFISVRRCADSITHLHRLQVLGFTLNFWACTITTEPFVRVSLNCTQMSFSIR